MLAFTGEEIRQIARKLGVTWREDASNAKDDYERNKLRHKVVPVLEELNPSMADTLKDTLARLWAADAVLGGELRKWEEAHLSEKDGYFELALSEEQMSYFVYESLKQRTGMNYKAFEQLETSLATGQSGKLFLTDTHTINLDRGRLIVCKLQEGVRTESVWVQENDASIMFPLGELQCSHGEAPVAIERSAGVALLDAGKLEFPLELRPWKEGDSFVPLGMKGQKKISDFMIDAKIPVNLKGRVYVLLSAGRVVWVVGKRIDDRFKITDATRKAYRIELC
jgi:tRNA(Ile)-lysidine synthase